jgi:YihY family inner membrane protein
MGAPATSSGSRRPGFHPAVARPARAVATFWRKAYEDNVTGLAGMVAYNMLLSLLPLALVALFIGGRVLSSAQFEATVIADLHRLLPSTENSNLTGLLNKVERSSTSIGMAALVSSVWIGASFWGALDTAFARIYHGPSRTWLQQKRFALAMLVVVLLFMAATVAVPTLQSVVAEGADRLPLGLSKVRGVVFAASLAGGVVVLFGLLCLIYRAVPFFAVPWRGVWPGALGATVAVAVVDQAFPFYLSHGSAVSTFGGTFVFIAIVLVWFYVLALIILGGAVINALRLAPTAR